MRDIFASIIIGITSIGAVAQETTDSIATQELREVVVQAPRMVRKADMDIYYPSKSAVENSKDGVQLLNNLMIPSLSVIDALNTIQAAGESVELRINGRKSTLDQVRTLSPETIKRVEWIDNPGLKYNGAHYVLNIIVTNPAAGGSLSTQARPALNQGFGTYMANAKLNSGKSQFEISSFFKLTNKIKSHRDYTETFTYPDGSIVTRNETSRGGYMDNSMGNCWASYSYIKPDTTIVMIDAYLSYRLSDRYKYDGVISTNTGINNLLLTDIQGGKGTTPGISAYWEQHLPKKQTIAVDFKSSFYFGRSFSDYMERFPEATDYLTNVHTMIKDRNQAYAIEADYIKKWEQSQLTAGVSYTANRNRSTYENLGDEVFHQRQDKIYLFAEYLQRINKVTLTAGLGTQYTDFLFKETNQGNSSWVLRPQATVAYRINQNHQLRLNFQSWQSTPSLAESNVTPQQTDGFQWRMGNPNLKTSTSYMLTLRYNFNIPRVSGTFGVRAFTSPDAITPYLYWDGDRLITTYENSRGLQNLSFFIAPQIDIIPDWLMISGYLQYRTERMRGTGYTLYNRNDWSGNMFFKLSHWGVTLSGQYVRAQHSLWGERISWGENISVIDLGYNWGKWYFAVGMIMPFGKYDQGSKMLSKWNTNEKHMRLNMRLPYINISYNLQWGRQRNKAQKVTNADANVDKSTAGGR